MENGLLTPYLVIAGHSLGGALATLAAYDVARIAKENGHEHAVTCITFGAPRTGNHAFAADFQVDTRA